MAVNNLGATSSAGGLKYYAAKFTSSGTFTLPAGFGPANPLTVEALVVGGGGGCAGVSTNGAPAWNLGGAGGGGGVRTDVLSLTGDTAVVVGKGAPGSVGINGAYMGGNGGCSVIGSTVKNMWINPQMLPANPIFGGNQMQTNSLFTTHWFATGGGPFSGSLFQYSTNATQLNFNSQPYRVTPGATYTLSGYAATVQNASGSFTITSSYYTASALTTSPTSSNTSSSFAVPGLGTAIRFSDTFTVPAGTDTVSFAFTPGQTSAIWQFTNFQLELGSSATDYADGDTSGYAWAGVPAGSETVSSSVLVAAAGGGGGGDVWRNNNTVLANTGLGLLGATSGGAGISFGSAQVLWLGGHGGGAGGSATQGLAQYNGTALTLGQGAASFTPQYGSGSYGQASNATNYLRGGPGSGVGAGGDYGRGGHGHFVSSTIKDQTVNSPLERTMAAVPNTGQGGSGWTAGSIQTLSSLGGAAQPGSDGIVILRYWA